MPSEKVSDNSSNPQDHSPDSSLKKDSRRTSSKKLLKVFNSKTPGKRQAEFNKTFSKDIPEGETLLADFR
jgi:hypothetical protein